MSVLLRGIFYLSVLILLCFNSTAIFSCRIPPAGAEGRWLGHLWVREVGGVGAEVRVDGLVTSHCGACHANISSPRGPRG